MKAICDRGALFESLGLIGGVAPSRTPKPALTCVHLTASKGGEGEGDAGLTLAATDQEVAAVLTTPRVEVNEPGEALIPADKLQQIVRESIDPTLTIETEQDTAKITGQDSQFKVFGHPLGDFPPLPGFEGEADFEIPADELHRLIAQTLFATARENSRYAINGVLIEREQGKLSVVATDGHRLALAKGSCKVRKQAASGDEGGASGEKGEAARSAIVPVKALNLLLRMFDDAEQTVRVKVADNQMLFATDQATLSTNLVEGNFPPYRDVIPKDSDKKASVGTDLFVSAVRRAALLTNEESKGVKMSFSKEGLQISSRAPEMGEAQINVEVPEYAGDPIDIGFNPTYLLDALKVLDESQVQLELKAPNKPGVMRAGSNFLYVIMPVNLS